jgi:hypothetical protein
VTRTRWLAGKMTVGLLGLLFAGLATVGINWWSAPIDGAPGNIFTPSLFSVRGVLPLAYTVFAANGLPTINGSSITET